MALEIVLLEAAARPGGALGSEQFEGALLEIGPDTLVTHKPAGLELCRELELEHRFAAPPAGRAEILRHGRLQPVPAGFALLAPTRRAPLLASPLLSWRGKARALVEPWVGAARHAGDESVASFVRRRFGDELLERIVEPIVGAITLADVERLSLAASFPRMLAREREAGSVTGRPRRGAADAPRRAGEAAGAAPMVVGLTGGMGQIVEALVARLPAGALRLNAPVRRLLAGAPGFVLELEAGPTIAADAVLLATPAHVASPLLDSLDRGFAAEMGEIAYASCVTVHLGWPRRAVARPPRSHGFFVPRTAGSELVAASFVDVKFPERVPAGQIVVRVFCGGALRPLTSDRDDASLLELARRELAPLLGVNEPPAWHRVFRHPLAIPQLAVGHLELAARLRARLAMHAGLELAGGPLGAYGLPDSIAAGEGAADRLFDGLADRDFTSQ